MQELHVGMFKLCVYEKLLIHLMHNLLEYLYNKEWCMLANQKIIL